MPDSITITLAGKDYFVRRLTLGQQRDLRVGSVRLVHEKPSDPAEAVIHVFNHKLDVIATATSRGGKDALTREILIDMETDDDEIGVAVNKILEFSGLVKKDDPKAGEQAALVESPAP